MAGCAPECLRGLGELPVPIPEGHVAPVLQSTGGAQLPLPVPGGPSPSPFAGLVLAPDDLGVRPLLRTALAVPLVPLLLVFVCVQGSTDLPLGVAKASLGDSLSLGGVEVPSVALFPRLPRAGRAVEPPQNSGGDPTPPTQLRREFLVCQSGRRALTTGPQDSRRSFSSNRVCPRPTKSSP